MNHKITLSALILMMAASALAAQMGTVDADDIPLLQGPRKDASVIRKLKKGTHLDVSNYPTQGYYKVRTPEKEIGWVEADVIDLAKPPGATQP